MTDIEPALAAGIILSDSVIREEGTGKCSYIGSFHNFTFPKFPFAAPPFVVTVFLTNLKGTIGQLRVTVRIEEKNSGHVVGSASAEIGFKIPVEPTQVFEIPFGIPPSPFPFAGNYHVVALVNNEPVGHKDLAVLPMQQKPQIS